jgi:diguanylate cyclase (GGDEF)-like protein
MLRFRIEARVSPINTRPSPPALQLHRGLGERSVLSLERALGRSPYATRVGALNSADLVVWQSARRSMLAAGLGFLAVLLRAVGVVYGPVKPLLAIVPIYIGVVALITLGVQRRGRASRLEVAALALTDVVGIFTTVALVTPPDFYSRGLLLALLALQFARMFPGLTASLTVVGASTIGYPVVLYAATRDGYPVIWGDHAWTFALFLLVGINGFLLQASIHRRLTRLVDLFSRAQRGDLSHTFIDEPNQEPDGITLLGKSYNHLRSELATMVLTDTLTSCLNRRGFERALSEAVHAGLPGRRDLSILAIDVDHFKSINDTAGHLAGDSVLRDLSAILRESSRVGDVVARVGGEEFVMLLPNADLETAAVVAERLMQRVRDHTFRAGRLRQRVTVSVGIACERISDAHVAGSLRARADEALYVAKNLGRNRAVMWAPGIRSNATPPSTAAV